MVLAVVVTSQLNATEDKRGNVTYTFREARELENRPANVLHFVVRRKDAQVEEAYFRGIKIRERAPFKLNVVAEPQFFSIRDERDEP